MQTECNTTKNDQMIQPKAEFTSFSTKDNKLTEGDYLQQKTTKISWISSQERQAKTC